MGPRRSSRQPAKITYDHVLDPAGDVIITLSNPSAPFAVWDSENDESAPAKNDTKKENEGSPEPPRDPITFRASSRHLILSSAVFKAALSGSWSESSKDGDGLYHIAAEEWDAEALRICLLVIHGRPRDVARQLDLEMLAQVAVISDYYQLHDVLYLFTSVWIDHFCKEGGTNGDCGWLPRELSRDLLLWIFIAWAFRNADVFTAATKTAILQITAQVQTMGLPIPSQIVGMLQWL